MRRSPVVFLFGQTMERVERTRDISRWSLTRVQNQSMTMFSRSTFIEECPSDLGQDLVEDERKPGFDGVRHFDSTVAAEQFDASYSAIEDRFVHVDAS